MNIVSLYSSRNTVVVKSLREVRKAGNVAPCGNI